MQILLLDRNGTPNKWINWESAVCYYAKDLVSWEMGGDSRTVLGGQNRITGKQSKIVSAPIIAVKGEAGRRKQRPPTLNNKELFRRDRHMCAYCGHIFGDSKLTRDHIIPRSKGGEDTWLNCVTCCSKCNAKKDDKTLEQVGMQLLYVPYVPTHAEYLLLQGRNITGDQMAYLLSMVDDKSRLKKELESKAA